MKRITTRSILAAAAIAFFADVPSVHATESLVQVMPAKARHYTSLGAGGNNYSNRDEIYAINGAGMNADGLTHASDAANYKMWMCQNTTATFLITLATNETGEAVASAFTRIKIFNCNWTKYTNRGVKGFSIWYGDVWPSNGKPTADYLRANFTKIDVGMEELPEAPGKTTYAGETFDLPSTLTAKYVAIIIAGNRGDGSGYTSLSEVQFFNRVVEAGDPFLPTAGLAETDSGLVVTGVVGNAAATVGYCALADDGEHRYESFAAEPTAVGESFSLPVDTTGWVIQQNFTFYALAKNDAGVTSNRLGRVFIGGMPSDRHVWVAPADAADLHASVAVNWSQGVPQNAEMPLMIYAAYGDTDVIWDSGVNGLTALVPPIEFSEYNRTFTVDSATPTAFAPRGTSPFTARRLVVGTTQPTEVTLDAGSYSTTEGLVLANGKTAGASKLTLLSGAEVSVGGGMNAIGSGSAVSDSLVSEVIVEKGAVLNVASTYSTGTASKDTTGIGNRTIIMGTAEFKYTGSDQIPKSMLVPASRNEFIIDGGQVNNTAGIDIGSYGNGSTRLTVKNGGSLKVNGNAYFHAASGPTLVEVLSGASLELGKSGYIGSDGDGANKYDLDIVVSNAAWTATEIVYMPRDYRGCNSHFLLLADEGEVSTATFKGGLELGSWTDGGGTRYNNSMTVAGGTLTVSGDKWFKIGRVGAPDQTNKLVIAKAATRVNVGNMSLGDNSVIEYRIPAAGFAATPVQASGTVTFADRSQIVVDASEVKTRGVHTLLASKTLSGFSTPEDIASRIVVKNSKLVAKPYVEGNSVKVKFKTGLVILLY